VTGQGGAGEGWGSAVRHDMMSVNSHVLDEEVNTPTVARLFEKLGSLLPPVGPELKQYGPQSRQSAIGQQRPGNRGLRPCNRGPTTLRLGPNSAIEGPTCDSGTSLRGTPPRDRNLPLQVLYLR